MTHGFDLDDELGHDAALEARNRHRGVPDELGDDVLTDRGCAGSDVRVLARVTNARDAGDLGL